MMPTEMLYGMEFQPNFIISLVTNVRCCTGNQFFSEAPGSGIKGRPAPEVATDAPQARLVLTSNFMGFACFFAMDLSSKSLAQDRKYLKYDKIQQLTQVCLKLGLHLSDLSGTTSRPSLSRDDAPSVTGTPWYNPFLHIPFRFFNKATRACTQHQHPELRTC
jgi:hypothetical protein